MSPPPPLPDDDQIPPVPRLPFALGSYASLPFRGRASAVLGVVRANERPFDFEDGLGYIVPAEPGPYEAGPSRPRQHGRLPLPRGHMGLGGALIASNPSQRTQRILDAAARSRRQRGNVTVEIPRRNALRIIDFNGPDDVLFRAGFEDPPNIRFLFGPPPSRDPLREIEYKTEYTHLNTPDAGFTHDFEVAKASETSNSASSFPTSSQANPIVIDDEDDEIIVTCRSPPSMSTALVCAMCLTTLVINAQAPEARVWGLRCGHLIDGACLAKISVPDDALFAPLLDAEPKSKGKGKARDVDSLERGFPRVDPLAENPIRSRLRSANNHNQPSDEGGESLLDHFIPAFLKRRKPRVKKPKIEAQYQWECPVSGCGRVHTTIRVDGVWIQEKELGEGAIGLFL